MKCIPPVLSRYLNLLIAAMTFSVVSAHADIPVSLIKDINPGGGHAYPRHLTNINGTLYFSANYESYDRRLWKTDGTVSGTVLVKNITPDTYSTPYSEAMTNVNGTLYFAGKDDTNGTELWKSDGTTAGTVLVKDIHPGTNSSSPSNLINFNGILYFSAHTNAKGKELWMSDGTAAGTVLVKDIVTGFYGSNPCHMTLVNTTLFFSTCDARLGLWKSDGTSAGTVPVKDTMTEQKSLATYLSNVNGTLYFTSDANNHGWELWKSDGTAAGTTLVRDIVQGSTSSNPTYLTNVNGTLYFVAGDTANGRELWKSDGTEAGTILVKDIDPGNLSSNPNKLINVNGILFFVATDGGHGYEVWRSDGTEQGTYMVKDIRTGTNSSYPISMSNIDNSLYFNANTYPYNLGSKYELWKSDGTEAGTVRLTDFTSAKTSSSRITLAGRNIYFSASSPEYGDELWKIPLNQAPSAVSNSLTISEDSPLEITLSGSDPDGDSISYSLNSQPSHGYLGGAEPNLSYTPNPNFSGTDSFSFIVSDGIDDSSIANITITIAPINDPPIGAITIASTVIQEQTLTLNNTLSDADGLGVLNYQWLRNGSAITGASNPSYTLSDDDVESYISVTANYTDGYGTNESVTSNTTGAVSNLNDIPIGSVTIAGAAIEDQLLTVTNTLSDIDGLGTMSYQWLRNGSAITGATNSTYSLDDEDVGAYISVTAIYLDGHGTNESVTSNTTNVVSNFNDAPTGSVIIAGAAIEDQLLTVTNTLSDVDGLGVISYQWLRAGGFIDGATSSTYTLGDLDVGAVMSVIATYTDNYGMTENVTSNVTSAVININDIPIGTVTIAGTAIKDHQLTASNTLTDDDGLGIINYQWLRNGTSISGATSATFTLIDEDIGTLISVIASYTDNQGFAESVVSTTTSQVTEIEMDSDSDGIPDSLDAFPYNTSASVDNDDDGLPDHWNINCNSNCQDNSGLSLDEFLEDSDNDGVTNLQEQADGTDTANPDSDGDGISDGNEKANSTNPLAIDSDNDGVTDGDEITAGTDPNNADTDGDGISDGIEGAGFNPPRDTDGDYTIDALDLDSDNDGLLDSAEGANEIPVRDSDGDSIPDFVDALIDGTGSFDIDGDGIADPIECHSFPNCHDSDNDGQPDYTEKDSDDDGIPDWIEAGPYIYTLLDTDGDGVPNYQDEDSDNDGIEDYLEALVVGIDDQGVPYFYDNDHDRIPDYLDKNDTPETVIDSDGDGIRDEIECPLYPICPDTNNDGQPDYTEIDSDGDGIPDSVEAGNNFEVPIDTDADGIPDYQDRDSDNDGIDDIFEAGFNPTSPKDSDNDGIPDYVDASSQESNDGDGGGIEDNIECPECADEDGDGVLDNSDENTAPSGDSVTNADTDNNETTAGIASVNTAILVLLLIVCGLRKRAAIPKP